MINLKSCRHNTHVHCESFSISTSSPLSQNSVFPNMRSLAGFMFYKKGYLFKKAKPNPLSSLGMGCASITETKMQGGGGRDAASVQETVNQAAHLPVFHIAAMQPTPQQEQLSQPIGWLRSLARLLGIGTACPSIRGSHGCLPSLLPGLKHLLGL